MSKVLWEQKGASDSISLGTPEDSTRKVTFEPGFHPIEREGKGILDVETS